MSQFLSQVPRQLLQQRQQLTPQLIQAMDILQLNAMALESRIEQEIDGNPALELVPGDDEMPEGPPEPATDRNEADPDAKEFERLDDLTQEYDFFEEDGDYRGSRSAARVAEEGDSKLDAMANAAARPTGLRDYLLEQWSLAEVDDQTRRIGESIIDALEDSGRLESSTAEIAAGLEPPATLEQVEQTLLQVQDLDPPGVAARSIQECLLLQLHAMPGDTELEQLILEKHFDDLQKNRLPLIARALGVEVDDVKDAIGVIGRLNLSPGLDVSDRAAPHVVPDVIVELNAETNLYETRLTRSNQRELRISEEFREALEKSRNDRGAREFIKQKIEAAGAIIDAIRFRRERLLEVSKAVVEAQRDFLDHGEQHVKVLRMSELATRFQCDPSTISRTVDDKWMQTPRGIYPLRRFFTGGTTVGGGEELGWDSIKAKVQEIVSGEDKSNPLNDDEIVDRLAATGIDIKRRTVAKYRAQLAIPTARQRRQY